MKNAPATSARTVGESGDPPVSWSRGVLTTRVVEALVDPVLLFEPPERVLLTNPAAEQLFHLHPAAPADHLLSQLAPPAHSDGEEPERVSWAAWSSGEVAGPLQFEGDPRWFRPVLMRLEKEQLHLLLLRDVTEEVRQLEATRGMRKEFLSTAAHKFNTPLTAIKMYVHLMKLKEERRGPESDLLPQLRALDHHLNRLSMEVQEVLDLAQLKAGGLTLHPHPMDLVGLVRRIIGEFSLHRSERKVIFEPQVPYLVGIWDEPRLEQVVRLLIDNADRYSPVDRPVLIHLVGDEKRARVEILDQGGGIPLEAQSRLFEPYFRAENVKSLRLGTGLGLGLHLCREIIRLHHGTIEIDSRPDEGTRVVVILPTTVMA